MHVTIGKTQLEEHEAEQLVEAVKNRLVVLEAAERQCAKAGIQDGVEEAQRASDTCSRLLLLLDPDSHEKAVVKRTQQSLFEGEVTVSAGTR